MLRYGTLRDFRFDALKVFDEFCTATGVRIPQSDVRPLLLLAGGVDVGTPSGVTPQGVRRIKQAPFSTRLQV